MGQWLILDINQNILPAGQNIIPVVGPDGDKLWFKVTLVLSRSWYWLPPFVQVWMIWCKTQRCKVIVSTLTRSSQPWSQPSSSHSPPFLDPWWWFLYLSGDWRLSAWDDFLKAEFSQYLPGALLVVLDVPLQLAWLVFWWLDTWETSSGVTVVVVSSPTVGWEQEAGAPCRQGINSIIIM